MVSLEGDARESLRVVIVTENFLPKVDGVTRCLARLLKHLQEEGHQVVVLGPEVNMSSYETYPIIGTVGIPLMLYPDLKLNFLRPKFLRAIREFNPDVVHFVDPIWLGPQVLFALRRGWCGSKWMRQDASIVASFHTNLPTYASLFGLKFLEPIMWAWIQNIHTRCRLTACPTLSTATMLMQKGVRNIRIWPRGVDLNLFGPHRRSASVRQRWGIEVSPGRCDQRTSCNPYLLTPPPSPAPSEAGDCHHQTEGCVILYVGRLSYEKNLLFLVESYKVLLEVLDDSVPPPVLVFVGEGPARISLEDLCCSKGIPARFAGHMSGDRLAECYASADLFAFPSYTETFGQVVLEALASGLPVIGLDADGTRDLVQHERSGLLLQYKPNRLNSSVRQWNEQLTPGSPSFQALSQQYAALLRRLVQNVALRGVMGEFASTSTPVGKSWDSAMGNFALITGLIVAASAQRAAQAPWQALNTPSARLGLQPNATGTAYGANVQRLQLTSLSHDDFTMAGHQSFPSHQMRIKRVKDFCDSAVSVYSGYLDVDYGAKHLFFYFFESRNDPNSDPVLMWINGGPGCSSSLGLFMELGPCSIRGPLKQSRNGTEWNPYSWNNNANLFLDQPVGVGFSYAEYGETISTTEEAAKNVQAFVTIFFETFAQFKGREFHMSGESYGGRYLPVFASEIVDQNKRAKVNGVEPINLKSVLIGNGITDSKTMFESYYDIQCKNLSVAPFQDISTCVNMKQSLPRCLNLYSKECVERIDPVGCAMAASFCGSLLEEPYYSTKRNPYDMTQPCTAEELQSSLCYPVTKHIKKFLNRPETRKTLGVHPSVGDYMGCSDEVGMRFSETLDQFHSSQWYITGLLERGIKVLIYVGTYDWICNWVGNQKWTLALDWTGGPAFNAEKDRDWVVDGQVAGITRSAKGLTFATVNAAGHMVPYDKPKEALAMLSRWLEGKEL